MLVFSVTRLKLWDTIYFQSCQADAEEQKFVSRHLNVSADWIRSPNGNKLVSLQWFTQTPVMLVSLRQKPRSIAIFRQNVTIHHCCDVPSASLFPGILDGVIVVNIATLRSENSDNVTYRWASSFFPNSLGWKLASNRSERSDIDKPVRHTRKWLGICKILCPKDERIKWWSEWKGKLFLSLPARGQGKFDNVPIY